MNQLEGEAAVTLRFPGEGGYYVFSGCFPETFFRDVSFYGVFWFRFIFRKHLITEKVGRSFTQALSS